MIVYTYKCSKLDLVLNASDKNKLMIFEREILWGIFDP